MPQEQANLRSAILETKKLIEATNLILETEKFINSRSLNNIITNMKKINSLATQYSEALLQDQSTMQEILFVSRKFQILIEKIALDIDFLKTINPN